MTHVSSFVSEDDDMFAEESYERPFILLFSANDENSLKSYCTAIDQHLSRLDVQVRLPDLAYTLSERRTTLFHRAYAVVRGTEFDDQVIQYGKKSKEPPRVGYVFTGQGAQWSQMGKALVDSFPSAKILLEELDQALQQLPNPPSWSLHGA